MTPNAERAREREREREREAPSFYLSSIHPFFHSHFFFHLRRGREGGPGKRALRSFHIRITTDPTISGLSTFEFTRQQQGRWEEGKIILLRYRQMITFTMHTRIYHTGPVIVDLFPRPLPHFSYLLRRG